MQDLFIDKNASFYMLCVEEVKNNKEILKIELPLYKENKKTK